MINVQVIKIQIYFKKYRKSVFKKSKKVVEIPI